MSVSPHVTVVIPAFNRAGYLETAVRSVLDQTFQNTEVVVVDDGSSDETVAIAERLAVADSRVHVIRHERNRGAQAARNTGARAARGRWIAFLDSDDHWLSHSLELRLKTAEMEGVNVVHSACLVQTGENEIGLFSVPALKGDIYCDLLRGPGPMFQGLLVSKQAFLDAGGLDEAIRSYQEWDTCILLARTERFGFVSDPTFIYNRQGHETISKDMLRDAQGYEQIVTKHLWSILFKVGPRVVSAHYRAIASKYAVVGDFRRALLSKTCSLMWWPSPPALARLASGAVRRIGSRLPAR